MRSTLIALAAGAAMAIGAGGAALAAPINGAAIDDQQASGALLQKAYWYHGHWYSSRPRHYHNWHYDYNYWPYSHHYHYRHHHYHHWH